MTVPAVARALRNPQSVAESTLQPEGWNASIFHPIVAKWFVARFGAPTEPQRRGWPPIAAGKHTLIAAPTGSGKTLTAFLSVIDRLVREAASDALAPTMRVLYISPLRALSNDMHRNLVAPLAEIAELGEKTGRNTPPITVGLRTGDTPSHKRTAMVRKPPHIFVTTPESLYLLLTSELGRKALRTVDTVIIDEIHALVRDKRGSHLALSLERLDALCGRNVQRIGLSATQRPIERMADFLVGSADRGPVSIVDVGHARDLDLGIEIPSLELSAVCSYEHWAEVHARIVELINTHRATMIFVNTRRMAERLTHQLTQILGEDAIGSHHGSLSADIRLATEQKLKTGRLKGVVATASLELGIDVGYVDLVIQIGSPRSMAVFLQRIGRSGHALGLTPKGRLFALTRDELLECMALIQGVRQGRLDVTTIPEAPLDILAQQVVAEVAGQEWSTDALFELCRRSYPYRNLEREQFDRIVGLLSEGLGDAAGRSRVYLHHDQVHRRVRARPSARLTALSNGGAIPEVDSYRVVAEPDGVVVGTVDEEFAVESMGGDIFALGNTSWRIKGLRGNDLVVSDAHGAPPTIPFWRGEAPGRTLELSAEVSRLRDELKQRLSVIPADSLCAEESCDAVGWMMAETGCSESAARQMAIYVTAQNAAMGLVPTQRHIVFERFFDESGGMQLVVHAPFGSRITRAWGLAMRKRFCRSFDFELQAAADDDGFVLSLGPQHSFPIDSLFSMLRTDNAQNLLEQALLAVPTFHLRWRWNVTRALLVARQRNGKKVPPPIQRFRSEDLLTAVFPKLTGCQENITGDHEIPDHPLVRQTMDDCLHEALDLDGLLAVLSAVEAGEIALVARDTREPSPFASELLNANPYAFLDGGEVQERRARAVATRRSIAPGDFDELSWLDPQAVAQVIDEAQPLMRCADELHDVLLSRIALPLAEAAQWTSFFTELVREGRAAVATIGGDATVWVAAERLPALRAAFGDVPIQPALVVPQSVRTDWTEAEAQLEIVRGLLEICGPIFAADVAARSGLTESRAADLLESLEGEGIVLRGQFTSGLASPLVADATLGPQTTNGNVAVEWCHRRLLARIHRRTMTGLRKEIEPVDAAAYLRFLTRRQGVLPGHGRTGVHGVLESIAQLQGLDLPAVTWERDLLPARVPEYQAEWLDELCFKGEVAWGRLFPPPRDPTKSRPMASLTRVAPISVCLREDLEWLGADGALADPDSLSDTAAHVLTILNQRGAMFARDLAAESQMLLVQLDDVLGELVARGFATADGFAGLRTLIRQKESRNIPEWRRSAHNARAFRAAGQAGRWSLWRPGLLCSAEDRPASSGPRVESHEPDCAGDATRTPRARRRAVVEQWAWQLLRRWGVVFRDILMRETGGPSWFELVQVYRRLEARGEVRGGRFIRGVSGEQFALGDAVQLLREVRTPTDQPEIVVISAADPLNLAGIVFDGPRVASTATNRVALWDGRPVAALQAKNVLFFAELSDADQRLLTSRLTAFGPPRVSTWPESQTQ